MLGFPLWLRIGHYLNIIFMTLLMRSGMQILADHPMLYWNDDCAPGSEWIKFGKKVMPKDKLWTSLDQAEAINPVLGITGGRHNLGAARRWHFFTAILWVTNGFIYVTLLFATGEWLRYVPVSWSIFPDAWHTFLTYASFHVPPLAAYNPFDPLQQLTYFIIIFILSPLQIITGLGMSPSFIGRFPWYSKMLGGKQAARSLHFLGFVSFVVFVIIHVTLVAFVHSRTLIMNITVGGPTGNWNLAITIFWLAILFMILLNVAITWYTLRHQRRVQDILDPFVNVFMRILGRLPSRQAYTEKDISPYFIVNGPPPRDADWQTLKENDFKDWKLEIGGLVKRPCSLSLEDLKREFTKVEQITKHNCIQGWSGVAKWGGVSVSDLIKRVEPFSKARYMVFYAYDTKYDTEGVEGRKYYGSFTLKEMMMPQSILAYEMNGKPLPLEHGAPLRVRAESRLGFKMVKYLKSIEFVDDLRTIGDGHGGYRQDVQFYDNIASI
ncbi:molybdopterin-dependent oxidoreductase [Patescibacteria group bacterium]|nr:molybdopterin-dependent oxidoreductase [Patescibacteria group bacterium]